jgi:dTMP kinase
MVAFLQSKGHDCVVTREPGGTAIGKKIRAILLDPASSRLDPMAELLLYAADRVQHVKELMRPSLAGGKTVLCDRYIDSTVVYQGYARGLDIGLIYRLHRLILDELTPDVTILLDLPPEVGLKRAWKQIGSGKRDGIETRFEEETILFHDKVRAGYLELSRRDPDRFRIIDASLDEAQVRRDITDVLSAV